MMHRNQSVSAHQFAMVPRADIPRASFNIQRAYKTTFDAGYLIPFLCEEILPGDAFRLNCTAFARLATPLFPVMDNLYLDTFYFFIPNRLVWGNWKKFMGEQTQPGDSISYVIPQIQSPAGGFPVNGLYDYFGLPTVGQVAVGESVLINALPIRAYALVYDTWFRDENLHVAFDRPMGDAGDTWSLIDIVRRGKRHDYFTSCLPWPQKGGTAVSIPLGTFAPVYAGPSEYITQPWYPLKMRDAATGALPPGGLALATNGGVANVSATAAAGTPGQTIYPSNLYADLTAASAATISQLRQSFQIQKLLERDARGGTRYTEIVRAHFGVISPDARLQRPEYLGGATQPLIVNPIAQTSATNVTGSTTPIGSLSGVGTVISRSGFSQSFTEHGHILGIVSVRADLTYQQGLRKMWSRTTRYDFYFPAFAMLGEQAVLRREIYCTGAIANDLVVFGYQERWAEYRYSPSQITGLFRSTSTGTIDPWHLSQNFVAAPTLGTTFIDETPPLSRVLAVGAAANGKQLIFDSFISIQAARPMPLYSVPGLIDHF